MSVLLGVAPAFVREMRVGSLEITAALALVALVAARPRVRAAAEIGRLTPMDVRVDVLQRGSRSTLRLRPPVEIGRADDAGLVLHDAQVSRRHARLSAHDGVVYLEDINSANGTFLNGRRVHEAIEVREGDEIDAGTTRIVVSAVRPA